MRKYAMFMDWLNKDVNSPKINVKAQCNSYQNSPIFIVDKKCLNVYKERQKNLNSLKTFETDLKIKQSHFKNYIAIIVKILWYWLEDSHSDQ